MWVFAMFDLPVKSKEARKRYSDFRKRLIQEGFTMLQYSVYARYCASEDSADGYRMRLEDIIPPKGEVRLLAVTDRQFGKMDVFRGKTPTPAEKPPEQLVFF